MLPGRVIVFDVGKTLAKLSLWGESGRRLAERQRYNERIGVVGSRSLDTEGIERWAIEVLREFGSLGPISAIVPVAHGAAAAVVGEGKLTLPVRDYEEDVPAALRRAYDAQRDPFVLTGSPALPAGLNLGVQLFQLEQERPGVLGKNTAIVPWPQYWAWRLSGVLASEVTSLGTHTDLWRPLERGPSALARNRGWWDRLAPLRSAGEVLGELTDEWASKTGLSRSVQVYCGVHDSNAALHGVRGFERLRGQELTVVSTGTWFVAMRALENATQFDMAHMAESRDCLVNVDVASRPVPSARFMGGREIELIADEDLFRPSVNVELTAELVRGQIMVHPGWTPGVGPYPHSIGSWSGRPRTSDHRAAAIALYLALMVDTCLTLIDARGSIVIEGRFAAQEIFVKALAALQKHNPIFVHSSAESGLSYGALRLVDPSLRRADELARVVPLDLDLTDYKTRWQEEATRSMRSAEPARASHRN